MYKNKYLKYKNKYLQFKNQIGGGVCRSQVPILCEKNTIQAGFCRRTIKDCNMINFNSKSSNSNYIYLDKDSIDSDGLYLYHPSKPHSKNLPLISGVTINYIQTIKQNYLRDLQKINDDIVKLNKTTLTYYNVFENELREMSKYNLNIFSIYINLLLNEPYKTEFGKIKIEIENFKNSQTSRIDVYNVKKHYYTNQYKIEKPNLSEEQQKYVEQKMISYKNVGINLEKKDREELEKNNNQIIKNEESYKQNISENVSTLVNIINVNEYDFENFNDILQEWKGKDNENYDNKTHIIKNIIVNEYNYYQILENCKNRDTRKQVEKQYLSLCQDNLNILVETLKLRNNKASILGYESYLEYKLEGTMVKNTSTLINFINNLRDSLKPLLINDILLITKCKLRENNKVFDMIIDNLCKKLDKISISFISQLRTYQSSYHSAITIIKKEEIINKLLEIIKILMVSNKILTNELVSIIDMKSYDWYYYSRIIKNEESKMNILDIKPYFTIESVTKGIFEIYQRLLGLIFVEITSEYQEHIYANDVKLFAVYYKSEPTKVIGYFYLDIIIRNGKESNTQAFQVYGKSNYSLPIGIIIGKLGHSIKDNLDFDNIELFFHEFGHLMHTISSTNTISELSGLETSPDFKEIPSQLFEEWCWCLEPLKKLALEEHREKINLDLMTKLNKQRKILQGFFYQRQILFSSLDMNLHSININNKNELINIHDRLSRDFIGYEVTDENSLLSIWQHIMTGYGYEGLYYGYQWSKVYAIDLFSFFSNGNEFNEELGYKLRDNILSKGATKDGLELLRDFMGREPNVNAFTDWLSTN